MYDNMSMKSSSNEKCFRQTLWKKIKTHFIFNNFFPDVQKYGTVRQATDDNIIRRMRFACCITKATDTHSEYVILIAFPRQQWLRESASMLLYMHIASLVHNSIY
jgi:hypothetical protein